MTDGIIQQVVKRYYLRLQEDDELDLSWHEVNIMFDRIEQELIEKIKQEFDDEGYLSHNTETLKKLIGDNHD